MTLPGKIAICQLEEDNPQRAYFRLRPVLVNDGAGFLDAAECPEQFPDEGYIRIVPDKNEALRFKNRMRSLGGYCLSRRGTIWMKYLILIITFTMFFHGGLIPTYMVNKYLGIVNTRWVIVLMGLISVCNIIIVRPAFQAIPASLEESAQLDGAGHMTILFRITFPLAKATIAVIALFYAVGKWNEYLNAAIYLTNRKLYPLQIILREILIESSGTQDFDLATEAGNFSKYKKLLQYSTIIFATLPILCVYPFVQKYFVKGVMIGSIKG